jgi:hypothetical protein
MVLAVAAIFLSIPAQASDKAPGEAAIKALLMRPTGWTMYYEFTDASTPGDRAHKMRFRYFEKDNKLMGRNVGLEFGGCDFPVHLRDDGFSFPWCPPFEGEPSLDYDPSDAQYPFKSRQPRKLWLQPNE